MFDNIINRIADRISDRVIVKIRASIVDLDAQIKEAEPLRNAGATWSSVMEEALRRQYIQGWSLTRIMSYHGRSMLSILKRLERLECIRYDVMMGKYVRIDNGQRFD